MEIIKVTNKGPIMDKTEKYHIYVANQNGIQLHTRTTGTHHPSIGSVTGPSLKMTIQLLTAAGEQTSPLLGLG
jgi:hypothetical protein